MITPYLVVKLIHILLAIAAVGFSSTFGITLATAAAKPTAVPFALQAVHRLERISSAAFVGVICTGVLMAWIGNLQWTALWFALSLTIALLALTVSRAVAHPTLLRQLELVERSAPPLEELRRLGARSRKVGMVLSLASLTIIGLMVFKPTL
jgi:hypothetical protein